MKQNAEADGNCFRTSLAYSKRTQQWNNWRRKEARGMMSSTSAPLRERARRRVGATSAWNYGKNSQTDQSKEQRSILTARPQKVLHGFKVFQPSDRREGRDGWKSEEQRSYSYPKRRSRATELRPLNIALQPCEQTNIWRCSLILNGPGWGRCGGGLWDASGKTRSHTRRASHSPLCQPSFPFSLFGRTDGRTESP